jgi:hypothetical protein
MTVVTPSSAYGFPEDPKPLILVLRGFGKARTGESNPPIDAAKALRKERRFQFVFNRIIPVPLRPAMGVERKVQH